ncbi:MAG: hypothetical protein LUO93_06355 [Methanomicrobiales archaeon]|nr:hypothetical protein [Methanomicrobiales archaeon]
MRKLFVGEVRYAAPRALIPVIEEFAYIDEESVGYFARLYALVVVEQGGTEILPSGSPVSLETLTNLLPELQSILEKVREILSRTP